MCAQNLWQNVGKAYLCKPWSGIYKPVALKCMNKRIYSITRVLTKEKVRHLLYH